MARRLAAFEKRQGDDIKASPQVKAEALAEEQLETDAEHAARDRETSLSRRAFQTLSDAQCEAMMYAVAVFFFVCRIPFAVVQHWAFVAMILALSPAFANHLKKRHCLADTWLPKLYHDTQEKAEARLAKAPGKKTIIIDGFKDRRGRHVMNTTVAKVGMVVYKRTAWFGKARQSRAVYGKEVEDIMAEEGEEEEAGGGGSQEGEGTEATAGDGGEAEGAGREAEGAGSRTECLFDSVSTAATTGPATLAAGYHLSSIPTLTILPRGDSAALSSGCLLLIFYCSHLGL